MYVETCESLMCGKVELEFMVEIRFYRVQVSGDWKMVIYWRIVANRVSFKRFDGWNL
jgi:hypothetical protein